MPTCIDKCEVMPCGSVNGNVNYTCDSKVIQVVEELNDLVVTRSLKLSIAWYKVSSIVAKADRMAGLISRAFRCRDRRVLRKVISTYVLPITELIILYDNTITVMVILKHNTDFVK